MIYDNQFLQQKGVEHCRQLYLCLTCKQAGSIVLYYCIIIKYKRKKIAGWIRTLVWVCQIGFKLF